METLWNIVYLLLVSERVKIASIYWIQVEGMPSALNKSSHFIPSWFSYEKGNTTIIPILVMSKLRFGKGRTGTSVSLTPEHMLLTPVPTLSVSEDQG